MCIKLVVETLNRWYVCYRTDLIEKNAYYIRDE